MAAAEGGVLAVPRERPRTPSVFQALGAGQFGTARSKAKATTLQ